VKSDFQFQVLTMSTVPANWQCPNCTLENLAESTICEVCDTQRPTSASHKQSAHNNNNNNNNKKKQTWKCSQCTFADNKDSSLHCEMCQSLNPNKTSHTATEYVWEWSSGKNWHEYPQAISDKIENAYFSGVLSIDWSLPHSDYVIDLTKLQQINQSTKKTRKIQRVRYEYETSKSETPPAVHADSKAEAGDDKKETEEEEEKMNVDVSAVDDDDTQWQCPFCTVFNQAQYLQCQVCCSDRPLDLQANSKDTCAVVVTPMEVSADERDDDDHNEDAQRGRKHKPVTQKAAVGKQEKGEEGTLLSMFSAQKNRDNKIPSPITSLKKKPKRKLKEMLNDNDEDDDDRDKKRIKMSEKNAAKQSGDSSIGATLNADLISALWELSTTERNLGNVHKANAYSKACKELRSCDKKIASGKEAKELKGIGVKIADKIDEMLHCGHIKKLDVLRSDEVIQAINELCQVHGIGASKARELVKNYRIRSIDELRQHTDLLNHAQRIGLQYFEYTNTRIPREHCTLIGEIVRQTVAQIDARIIFDICGSYRRGKNDCGDIDILLTHSAPKYENKQHCKQLLQTIVSALKDRGLLVADLCHGPVQYMGICRHEIEADDDGGDADADGGGGDESIPADFTFTIPDNIDGEEEVMITLNASNTSSSHNKNSNGVSQSQKNRKQDAGIKSKGPQIFFRRIDLKFKPFKFYYANLLHFTGSDRFNTEIRKKAHEKNLILNEDGVYRMTDPDNDRSLKSAKPVIEPKSEQEIFDVIGMSYVEPKNRSW